ncbi:unnamed protein product [Kuraishia capsulata CBS 1993]|uniref:Thioredoxin domain-containing protein n=1 Tax=Kuraishia capsulata CBS 1993 TaxID=1382522 RepID=W6MKX6_9ASCO|nr:uncharacterized protein KUCA_T00003038001 [Kuraishia capsulata CBS 1993]CDK27061.1 unnamed protein product [Kuraishia capsulata CBS 1993]
MFGFFLLLFLRVSLGFAIELSDSDFDLLAFGQNKYSLVNFYSKSCAHCYHLAFHYDPLETLFNNTDVQIIKIDGITNKAVRARYGINTFPKVILFDSNGQIVAQFQSERTTDNLVTFVRTNTGVEPNYPDSSVVRLAGTDDFEKTINSGKEVVMAFVYPWTQKWDNIHHSFYENLAHHYNVEMADSSVVFCVVDAANPENAETVSLLQVDRYPTVFKFPGASSASAEVRKIDHNIDQDDVVGLLRGEIGQTLSLVKLRELKDQLQAEDSFHDDEATGWFHEDL